jgi:hypothetical protein
VRDWVSTGRLQFTSTRCFGDRFGLLSHAAGFIDPLFSRGLSNTVEVNGALATTLLAALDDDDLSAERFSAVEQLQQNLIDGNDKLVSASYSSFRDFELWNAPDLGARRVPRDESVPGRLGVAGPRQRPDRSHRREPRSRCDRLDRVTHGPVSMGNAGDASCRGLPEQRRRWPATQVAAFCGMANSCDRDPAG